MSDIPEVRDGPTQKLILVTGPSGAGRSTAINILEDFGCETIDNLPLSLVPRLLDGPPSSMPLALGLDVRNRDFSIAGMLVLLNDLIDDPRVDTELLFLECSNEVLRRRFSETRRRHPLSPKEPPDTGIEREGELLEPVRAWATHLVDTTELSPHDLRTELARLYVRGGEDRLAVSVHSFSYKRGVPRDLDTVFDCRFLRNPHWDAALRPLTGPRQEVADYVEADPLWPEFFRRISELIHLLLPAYRSEGKTHLSIGFGCTGGKHRSVASAQNLANRLEKDGWQVSIRHRELERRARSAPPEPMG